jgi:nicotinate-nucleotide adenylyltransferase
MLVGVAGRRIGVFGGTFDPVHIGHLIMAQDALDAFALDQVLWVPSSISPHKRHAEVATPEHRLAMLGKAVAGHPAFAVSDLEVRRAGVSFTVDTMRQLQLERPGERWHFIIGSDTLQELHTWKDVEVLLGLCRFVTVVRPGAALDRSNPQALRLPDAASRRVLDDVVTGHLIGVASTEIRQRVRNGQSIRYLVPAAVEAYIAEHTLYKTEDDPSKP